MSIFYIVLALGSIVASSLTLDYFVDVEGYRNGFMYAIQGLQVLGMLSVIRIILQAGDKW